MRLSRLSRLWPLRRMTHELVQQQGGVRFRAAGAGAVIDALYLPASHQALRDQAAKLPIIFAHGWIETKEFHLREAVMLSRAGHDVVLLDLRCHGRSTGACVTFGVLEKRDVAAVIDEANRRGMIGGRVIVMGYSLGAATMLQFAADDPRAAAVIAIAPFVTMSDAVRSFHRAHRVPLSDDFVQHGFALACRRYGFEMGEASTIAAVRRLQQPALFICGTDDGLLPDALHTRKLVEAKNGGPQQYLQVKGAGHLSICLKTWPAMDQAILRFAAEVNGDTADAPGGRGK